MTCWAFKRKTQAAMASSGLNPLEERVDVDEMAIGGHDEGSPGRSKADKKLVSLAVEIREDGKMGRAYGRVVNNYSSQELEKIFDKHIQKRMPKSEQINGADILLYKIIRHSRLKRFIL